jgi:hypothetical protein
MARHAFIPPAPLSPGTNEPAIYQANAQSLRDCLRDGWVSPAGEFNVALPSPRWKVSDIGIRTITALEQAFFFLARDTTNNCEYLFVISGRDATTSPAEFNDGWGATVGHGDITQHVTIAYTLSPTVGNNNLCIGVYFNPDYATSSMARSFGFDNATDLTYTGGDFTEVTTAPSTNAIIISDWLPAGGVKWPKGFVFYATPSISVTTTSYMLVFDDVLDNLSVFVAGSTATASNWRHVSQAFVLGRNVIVPSAGGDTYTQGGAWWYMPAQATSMAYAHGYSSAGVLIHNYTQSILSAYTAQNQFTTLGDVKWRQIPITSPSDTAKGHLHPSVALEIGAWRSFASFIGTVYGKPTLTDPMVKMSEQVVLMYVDAIPYFPFPFDGWGTVREVTV